MKIITCIATAPFLLISACGPSDTTYTWEKPGSSVQDLQRDSYACERDTRQAAASFSGGLQGAGEAEAFGKRCMYSKGWRLEAHSSAPSARVAPWTSDDLRNVQCRFSDPPRVLPGTAGFCRKNGGQIVGG